MHDNMLQFFRDEPGFARLIGGMFDLYLRYERCFGAVRLLRPTPEEEKALSAFFKRDYYDQALIRISLADFERQLQKTYGASCSLAALLEGHLGRGLAVRTEPRPARVKDVFSHELRTALIPAYEGTPAEVWLRDVLGHLRRTYRPWAERYAKEPEAVTEMLEVVCRALNALHTQPVVRLAEFARQHVGHPTAFDMNGSHGPLFLRALSRSFGVTLPHTLEDAVKLYWQAGLLHGGALSQVTVWNVFSRTPHPPCTYYNDLGHPHALTLENMAFAPPFHAHRNLVFIIESGAVFSMLVDRLRADPTTRHATMVCAAGGLSAALLHVLQVLAQSGAALYFSGNMDYRGLHLADSLHQQFGKAFSPWRYGKSDYELALASHENLLLDEKKELAMHNDELAALLSYIRKRGKTTGHLPLMPLLEEDIRALLS